MHRHSEAPQSNEHAYTIEVGGTADGKSMRDPVGYGYYQQHWENNVALSMENVGREVVVNPRISVNGTNRWHSLEEIVCDLVNDGMTEAEKARAIWEFARRHRYHSTTADDEVKDTVKMLNVYGYTLCWDEAYTVSNLWQAAGLPVRRGVPHGHCTTEVFYDGAHHLLDSDEHLLYLLRDNETVAGEEDLARDHDLVKRGHAYGVLSRENRQSDESAAALFIHEGPRSGGRPRVGTHRMDCSLRPGEALVWQWQDRGLYHGYGKRPPRLCNGAWHFTPRLDATFDQWCVRADNARSTDDRLYPIDPSKPIALVYRLQTPYVMVGGLIRYAGDLTAQCALSRDGLSWQPIGPDGTLTPLLPSDGPATYDLYLRIEGDAKHIDHIAVELDLQMAPLSLPGLSLGENRVLYTDESADRAVVLTHSWNERDDLIPPAAPRLTEPINGEPVAGTQPVFCWDPVPDAVDYQFELCPSDDMRYALSPVFEKLVSNTPFAGQTRWSPPENGQLNPEHTYFWRVRARSKKGLWGPWSNPASFTPSAPGIPLDVELHTDWQTRTQWLRWRANPQGSAPERYIVYASDERGFSARDGEHEVFCGRDVGMEARPGNRFAETDQTELQVVGAEGSIANKSYYRVVTIDEHGTPSGPSDLVCAPRPFIFSQPPQHVRAETETHYAVQSLQGAGDLRCISDGTHRYQSAIRDFDTLRFILDEGPAFISLDGVSGLMIFKPTAHHLGLHTVTLRVQNGQGGVDIQGFDLEVLAPHS